MLNKSEVRKNQRVTALLDGDILAVRAAAVNQGGDPMDIIETLHYLIQDWTQKAHADTCKVFVSEGKCFRYQSYEPYKANRKDKPKPRGTDGAKEYLLETYAQEVSNPLYEADDRMGLYATEDQDDEVRIIVSSDKDMKQVPAYQMCPDKCRFPWKPDWEYINRWRAEQILRGDPVDGYPGLKIRDDVHQFGEKAFQNWWDDRAWGDFNPGEWIGTGDWEDIPYEIQVEFKDRDLYTSQLHCATILHHHLEPGYIENINSLYTC